MDATFQFVAETHQYFNAQRVLRPSVTQILQGVGLVDYSHVRDEVLERKAEIGTAAHAACHYHDEGDLNIASVDPAVLPYVNAWLLFRQEAKFVPELIEHRGIATVDGMEYGFTLDRLGMFDGRPWLIEIKCTAGVEISWGPQLAAYELALRPTTRMALRRMAVHLKPNGKYSLIEFSDAKDYQIFKWALGVETWKLAKRRSNGNGNNHIAR